MAKNFIFVMLMSLAFALNSQKSIRIFVGSNYTNVYSKKIWDYKSLDSLTINYYWLLLPQFGVDYNIPINRKITLNTGIGLSFMGAGGYFKLLADSSVLKFEIYEEYKRKYPNLTLNYLRIPLLFKYKLNNIFDVYLGYSFQYLVKIDKNTFYNDGDIFVWNPVYYNKNYFHTANFGINITIGKVGISAGAIIPLSKIEDSGYDWSRGKRFYSQLYGCQLSVGYIILE